jgi:hypothetical protein
MRGKFSVSASAHGDGAAQTLLNLCAHRRSSAPESLFPPPDAPPGHKTIGGILVMIAQKTDSKIAGPRHASHRCSADFLP